MQYFEEVQRFRQPWIWAVLLLSLGVPLVVFGYALIQQLIPNEAFGNKPASGTGFVVTAVPVLAILVLFYKMKLVTRVDSEHLHIVFSPLRRRDIALSDISHWQALTYNPILDYGGWGIRVGRRGWAYNVSGNRGVELQLTDGKKLLIGSQRAEELSVAISAAKRVNEGSPNSG